MSADASPIHQLRGRRALVTAASGRLGRAIAVALASAGASVAVHYRGDEAGADETVSLLKTTGQRGAEWGARASTHHADLADDEACRRLVDEAREALGGLDVLVNNAAMFERTPLDALEVADFDRHVASNARSVFSMSLHAGRAMRADGGDIVNVADVAGLRPWPAYVPYSASKAAVVSLTQGFAKALAPRIRVNAVAPGPVLPPAGGDEEQGRRAVAATLLKRWGAPADVTAAVLFLLRATYVTGYVLPVDGGRLLA